MNNFSIIVAVDQKNGIGKNNQLPWHLPEELKYFKRITTQTPAPELKNVVIMGRKTWESIPEKYRPLPDRYNVVVTRNPDYTVPDNVLKAGSFSEALRAASRQWPDTIHEIFVIGGQQIFEEALKDVHCEKLYITHIEKNFDCDTFFPPFSTHFTKVHTNVTFQHADFSYTMAEYKKIL